MGIKTELGKEEIFFLICANCGFRQMPSKTVKEQSNTRLTHFCEPAIYERSCWHCAHDTFRMRSKNFD